MKAFKDDIPIYLQLRQQIEEQILVRALKEDDRLKSLREMAAEYRINPITAGNAVNALVDEGILYHKRGIGIFVSDQLWEYPALCMVRYRRDQPGKRYVDGVAVFCHRNGQCADNLGYINLWPLPGNRYFCRQPRCRICKWLSGYHLLQ